MGEFEQWFANQDLYMNMRFIHGDNLFSKDGDVYRVLPVQMAYVAYQKKPKPQRGKSFDFDLLDSYKKKIEQLEKRISDALAMADAWKNSNTDGVMSPSMRHIMLACASEIDGVLRGES